MTTATATTITAPPIYVGLGRPPEAGWLNRGVALLIAAGALAVLLIAAWLTPDAKGYGTHEQLGMQPCGFYQQFGIPCAGCGMTTSFAYLVHGHPWQSFVNQPFGMILCVGTAAAFWGGLYVATTGRAAYRILNAVPAKFHVIVWPTLAIVAWAWKIALSVRPL